MMTGEPESWMVMNHSRSNITSISSSSGGGGGGGFVSATDVTRSPAGRQHAVCLSPHRHPFLPAIRRRGGGRRSVLP